MFKLMLRRAMNELGEANREAVPLAIAARDQDRRGLFMLAVAAAAIVAQSELASAIGSNAIPAFAALGGYARIWLWLGATILCFGVVPALAARLCGFSLADLGAAAEMPRDMGPVIALMGSIAVLAALAASFMPGFATLYPFWRPDGSPGGWMRFALFEAGYVLQFAAVEFLFRGVLIHALRHRLGAWSVLLPLIPYVMLHFGKPLPEVLASAAGGVILGVLSLTRRSILAGIVLHAVMALSMDWISLARFPAGAP